MRVKALCSRLLFSAAICIAIISVASLDARAATDPCPSKIIKDSCTDVDVAQFESDSLKSFLAFHGLPSTDATIVYTHGRPDVRNEVRAFMFVRLLDIIHRRSQGNLSTHEFKIYRWFLGLIKPKEQALYGDAVALRNDWQGDKCSWTPDSTIATLYGLFYGPPKDCSLLGAAPSPLGDNRDNMPTASYFLAAGLKKNYGDPLINAAAASLMADVNSRTAILWGAAKGSPKAAAATGIVLVSSLASEDFRSLFAPTIQAANAIGSLFTPANAKTDREIFESVLTATQAVKFESSTSPDFSTGLQDLDTLNTNAAQDPYLYAFLRTELGVFKLSATFVLATLPQNSSSSALPSHRTSDPSFVINGNTVNATFLYRDWTNTGVSVQTYGGWFLKNLSIGALSISAISPSLEFLGTDGKQYFLARLADQQFLIVKREDPSASFASDAVSVASASGNATIRFPKPPAIVAPASTGLSFSEGGSFDFVGTGIPKPELSLVSVSPSPTPGFITSQGGDLSTLRIRANPKTVPNGEYTLTVQAQNAVGTVSQTLTVTVGDAPRFPTVYLDPVPLSLSPGTIVNPGVFVSHRIAASGDPAPTVNIDSLRLPDGLSLQSNVDGSLTLSGTLTTNVTPDRCGTLLDGPRLEAVNPLGTTGVQEFLILLTCAAPATLIGPTDVTFVAGVFNSITFNSEGGDFAIELFRHIPSAHRVYSSPKLGKRQITMRCHVDQIPDLSWLTCVDNGDGTATLSGTPPTSLATRTFTESWIQPHAEGSVSDITAPTQTLYIAPRPLFDPDHPLTDTYFFSARTDDFGRPLGFANFEEVYLAATPPASTFTKTGFTPSALTIVSGSGSFRLKYSLSVGGGAEGGAYPITVVGSSVGPDQLFPMTVFVFSPPKIVSLASTTFQTGQGNAFTVVTTGFPRTPITDSNNPDVINAGGMGLSISAGTLPSGVTFTSNGNGSGQFSGTPCSSCTGSYPVTIKASNRAGSGLQEFTLIVAPPDVPKITPTITWTPPAPITYGTPLSSTQLNATASVSGASIDGSFLYNPPAGTTPAAGINQPLSVTFMPTDTTQYAAATAANSIAVDKATPSITWPAPAAIMAGTALSGTQLNATASIPGTFEYLPPAQTVLNGGLNQTLSVRFTPNDAGNYDTTSATTSIDVNVVKTAPAITWAAPADIVYGTSLGPTQLNASAVVAGEFTYTPPLGTLLQAGNAQLLSVAFAPSDTFRYLPSSATVSINVAKAPASVSPNTSSKTYGSADPEFTGALSGFLAADGVTASYARTPGENVSGNPYTISATLSASPAVLSNYIITNNTGTFTINKLAATVTAGSGTKVYGTADPALGAVQTGFLAADASGITLSATRAPGAAVGNYAITATAAGGAANNYYIAYVPGNLSITPAPLTVKANNLTRPFGIPNPALTTTFLGLVNGDSASAISGTAALSTTATQFSLPGTYPISISPGTLSSPNYTFTFLDGDLNVTATGSAPVSGSGCNGAYTGSINGKLTVSNGQTCVFYGGGNIGGNVQLNNGGKLILIGQNVNGNVQASGNSHVTITGGSVGGNITMQTGSSSLHLTGASVDGNVVVQNLFSNGGASAICGATIAGNVTLQSNGSPFTLGDGTATCPANTIDGNTILQSNTGSLKVFNNTIDGNLICESNSSIIGAANTAKKKQNQCSAF